MVRFVGVIGVGIDITEKKRADKLHRMNAMSEEQVRQLEVFGGALAHELRTPLASVKIGTVGLEQLLPKLLHGYKMAQENNLLEKSEKIPAHKLPLIDALCERNRNQIDYALFFIDFAIMNIRHKGIDRNNFEPLSITDVINLAVDKYPFTENERAKIRWDSEKNSDFIYLGEPTLTCHLLFNLLKNALYFTHYDSQATITITLQQHEDVNQLTFTDTGSGISPDILPHIFEQFYTRRESGSGIGLAFCQLVMDAYDGNIECTSEVGQYTTFTLSFPKFK